MNVPRSSTRAVEGSSEASLRSAEDVLVRARASIARPASTSPMMKMTAS